MFLFVSPWLPISRRGHGEVERGDEAGDARRSGTMTRRLYEDFPREGWKEPAYRRRQQAAETAAERRQNAQDQDNKVRAIGKINSGINALAAEQIAKRRQADYHENKKKLSRLVYLRRACRYGLCCYPCHDCRTSRH
jgi:hypothetical protein